MTDAEMAGGRTSIETPSLARMIETEIKARRVELPVLPEVAIKVREVVERDGPLAEVVAVVEQEPAFAAALLRYANSVAFSGLRAVTDLKQAITRLGMRSVEQTVLGIAARNAFKATGPDDERVFRTLWDHSLLTALASRRLAARVVEPELAFLGGLLHDVGKVVILRCVANLRRRDQRFRLSDAAMREFFDSLHCTVGDAFLDSWNIPAAIRLAVRRHHDARFESQDDALAAVVSCADLVARKLGASLEPDPDVSILDAPAARLLRLDDVKVAALVVDVEDDLARLRQG